MLTINQAVDLVNKALDQIKFPDKPTDLYQPISYTLESGGKRIRPALCLLANDLFDPDVEKAIDAALGIEIFHNFTLLHDDIMDHSPIRRGRPTVYTKWSENIAILSGDTMFAVAYRQFFHLDPTILGSVLNEFTKAAIEVCEGQQYDMDFETQSVVSLGDYLEMIRLKTAVLIAASLKIGSMIGKASAEDSENLYYFGENIGIAFQLQDDLLDTFGDVEKFGKSIGNDIRTNKNTFLKIKAFELADPHQQIRLKEAYKLEDPELKVKEVIDLFNELHVKERLITEMFQYLNQGIHHLDQISAPENKKAQLRNYARFMIERDY